MVRKELIGAVREALASADYRKHVKMPKRTLHISDDEGVTKDFTIKFDDKYVRLSEDDVAVVIDTMLEIIKEALRSGESVDIRGFGSFCLKYRQPRSTKLIANGKRVDVDGRFVPRLNFYEELRNCGRIYAERIENGELISPQNLQYDSEPDDAD